MIEFLVDVLVVDIVDQKVQIKRNWQTLDLRLMEIGSHYIKYLLSGDVYDMFHLWVLDHKLEL